MENKAEVAHWETGVLHVSNLPMKMSASPFKPYLAVPPVSPTSTERGLLRKRGDLPKLNITLLRQDHDKHRTSARILNFTRSCSHIPKLEEKPCELWFYSFTHFLPTIMRSSYKAAGIAGKADMSIWLVSRRLLLPCPSAWKVLAPGLCGVGSSSRIIQLTFLLREAHCEYWTPGKLSGTFYP